MISPGGVGRRRRALGDSISSRRSVVVVIVPTSKPRRSSVERRFAALAPQTNGSSIQRMIQSTTRRCEWMRTRPAWSGVTIERITVRAPGPFARSARSASTRSGSRYMSRPSATKTVSAFGSNFGDRRSASSRCVGREIDGHERDLGRLVRIAAEALRRGMVRLDDGAVGGQRSAIMSNPAPTRTT